MRRSMLFVPGNNPKMMTSCGFFGADAVIFDLEDAVSPQEKDAARRLVHYALTNLVLGATESIVRVNSTDTAMFRPDLEQIVPQKPSMIMLPKTSCAEDVLTLARELDRLECEHGMEPGSTGVIALIETALGVENGVFNGGFFSGSPLLAAFGIFLLDYIIAFTVLGIGGIFRDKIKNKPLALVCGILLAGLLRYVAHVISGAIFFGIWGEWFFTQEGFFAWGQTLVDMFPGKTLYVLYSLIYNLFFLLPEVGLTALVGFLIAKAMPKLLQSQQADR